MIDTQFRDVGCKEVDAMTNRCIENDAEWVWDTPDDPTTVLLRRGEDLLNASKVLVTAYTMLASDGPHLDGVREIIANFEETLSKAKGLDTV